METQITQRTKIKKKSVFVNITHNKKKAGVTTIILDRRIKLKNLYGTKKNQNIVSKICHVVIIITTTKFYALSNTVSKLTKKNLLIVVGDIRLN